MATMCYLKERLKLTIKSFLQQIFQIFLDSWNIFTEGYKLSAILDY